MTNKTVAAPEFKNFILALEEELTKGNRSILPDTIRKGVLKNFSCVVQEGVAAPKAAPKQTPKQTPKRAKPNAKPESAE